MKNRMGKGSYSLVFDQGVGQFGEWPYCCTRARIFSHFMYMEKTSGLSKTYASLWSPLFSFSFLSVILPFCLSHKVRCDVFENNLLQILLIIVIK